MPRHRQLAAAIPGARAAYQYWSARNFERALKQTSIYEPLYHNLCYAPEHNRTSDIATVFDLSHVTHAETHPKHRVRFLTTFIRKLCGDERSIITISESIKSEMMEHFSIKPERVHVTPLAADQSFSPKTKSESEKVLLKYSLRNKEYVLCVATNEPRKNLNRLLEAYISFPESLQKQFPLVMVGAMGWKNHALSRRISQLSSRGLIKHLGYVPRADLPFIYSAARCFVFPSLYEGFGLPLLEAMQSGCACITSNSGALAEVASDAALLFDPLKIEDIRATIYSLLDDSKLSSILVDRGIKRAQDFSWAQTARKTWEVYEQH